MGGRDRAVAEAVLAARRAGTGFPDLDESDRPRGEQAGYAVQAAAHALRGAPLVGWKVGCTNKVMQDMLNIPGPAVGGMTTLLRSGATVPFDDFLAPGVECEIAFRLGADVTGANHDGDGIAAYVDGAMASLEIVDNRYGDIPTRPVGEMIADDFFHVACVLAPEAADWRALDYGALKGMSEKNGAVRGEGVSDAVLGHPLAALAWAANVLAAQGRPLKAGHVVTTGTIAPCLWVTEPGAYAIEVAGLGRVAVTFA